MYILIVIFLAGYGPRNFIVMQEFTTLEKCEKAQKTIKDATSNMTPFCVEK